MEGMSSGYNAWFWLTKSYSRPMLFRTSSLDVTSAFRSVSRPHGSTLSSDAFKRKLIRSGTDFSVYEAAGMRGLDLAFYRQRYVTFRCFESSLKIWP